MPFSRILELNTKFAATTFSTNTRSRNASKVSDNFFLSFQDEPLHNSQNEIENPSNSMTHDIEFFRNLHDGLQVTFAFQYHGQHNQNLREKPVEAVI